MNADDRVADAFDVPIFSELSSSSRLAGHASHKDSSHLVQLPPLPELAVGGNVHDIEHPPVSLDLPPLADIDLNPLDDDHASATECDTLSHSSASDAQPTKLVPPPGEDVWQLALQLPSLKAEPTLLSWDAFSRHRPPSKPRPLYLSEAGPAAFDAWLQHRSKLVDQPSSRPVQPKALLQSLWHLGFGRESLLFPFNPVKECFEHALPNSHAHGVSSECSQHLVDTFLASGNAIRRLRTFVDVCFMANGVLPAVVTFAHAVDVVLNAIEAHATETGRAINTLLQLQNQFEPIMQLLQALTQLTELAEKSSAEQDFLNAIFAFVQKEEHASRAFRNILENILARSASNWLHSIEVKVGFVADYDPRENDDTIEPVDADLALEFASAEDRQLIGETMACLRHLDTHYAADDTVSRLQAASSSESGLVWKFDWGDLDRIHNKAMQYHADVREALLGHAGMRDDCHLLPTDMDVDGHGTADVQNSQREEDLIRMESSTEPAALDKLPDLQSVTLKDVLLESAHTFLSSTTADANQMSEIRPPLALTLSSSLRPHLEAQNHLLSYLTAHLLLHQQDLRTHLDLHYTFSFFASGLFTARLQHVLFSSETESSEREKGTVRTGASGRGITTGIGLKLGTGERQAWPPASSEVRLALMGLLGDVWREERALIKTRLRARTNLSGDRRGDNQNTLRMIGDEALPGGLSFSIRTDLTDNIVDRILNVDSIAALDFLKLTYEPPAPLAPLFSPRTLQLYDRVFGLWLRLVRVTAALSSIFDMCRNLKHVPAVAPSDSRLIFKVRHSAHTFMNTLTSHFRIAGIDAPWTQFRHELEILAEHCRSPVPPPLHLAPTDRAAGKVPSLATLQALHDRALQKITANLLLRKKQRRAADALEGICEDILALARHLQTLASTAPAPGTIPQSPSIVEIDAAFEEHARDFRSACEVLVVEHEKTGTSATAAGDEDGITCIKDLLSVLDGQDAHARRRHA